MPGEMTYLPDDSDTPGAPAPGERAGSRRALGCAFEVVETLVLTLLIYLVIHNFVAQPFEVQQSSMVPTIVDGEYILIDKLTTRFDGYHYGDVVVFEPPNSSGLATNGIPFIKRVIGMPGDTVEIRQGTVYVNETFLDEPYVDSHFIDRRSHPPVFVDPGHYYVLGDHRNQSNDSRMWGLVPEKYIYGKAVFRYWPMSKIGSLD
jgi:signal peptidase I